jgi:predicted lysophospholipase L1 biosynthesis ABC-type transport system permease subunit
MGGGLLMVWVAGESFSSVDRLLARPHPVATAEFKELGRADARLLLRYQVSEQNRWYFATWEGAQIVTGALFFFFLLFATREKKFALLLVLLMIAAVLAQRFLLTPGITSLGRMIDFVPPDAPIAQRNQFWVLHSWYWGMELVKWALGLALAARLVWRRGGRSGNARQQFDMVDKANYRHVNGL